MRILAVGRQILEPLEIMDLFLVSNFCIENEESTIEKLGWIYCSVMTKYLKPPLSAVCLFLFLFLLDGLGFFLKLRVVHQISWLFLV